MKSILHFGLLTGAVIENTRSNNSSFTGITDTDLITHGGQITLTGVTVQPEETVKSLNTVPAAR